MKLGSLPLVLDRANLTCSSESNLFLKGLVSMGFWNTHFFIDFQFIEVFELIRLFKSAFVFFALDRFWVLSK